ERSLESTQRKRVQPVQRSRDDAGLRDFCRNAWRPGQLCLFVQITNSREAARPYCAASVDRRALTRKKKTNTRIAKVVAEENPLRRIDLLFCHFAAPH